MWPSCLWTKIFLPASKTWNKNMGLCVGNMYQNVSCIELYWKLINFYFTFSYSLSHLIHLGMTILIWQHYGMAILHTFIKNWTDFKGEIEHKKAFSPLKSVLLGDIVIFNLNSNIFILFYPGHPLFQCLSHVLLPVL